MTQIGLLCRMCPEDNASDCARLAVVDDEHLHVNPPGRHEVDRTEKSILLVRLCIRTDLKEGRLCVCVWSRPRCLSIRVWKRLDDEPIPIRTGGVSWVNFNRGSSSFE